MGKLIPFGPDGRQAVTEADLSNIVVLQERAANTQARIDLIAASVTDRLKAGAAIPDDCLHNARLETVKAGGVVEERLIIDGVIRWRRIAGSAAAIRRNANILASEPS